MKFTCAKNELKDALTVANRAVAVKPQTPILAGIYLRAEGSTLEMQANNFSLGIITKIAVNTEVPGEIVVVGKYFQEIIAKLPGETVTISYDSGDNIVYITSGASKYNLLAMSAEDFPKVKTQEVVTSFKIRAAALKDLIKRTVFACATDDAARPIFTGCLFELNGNSITVAATNTHRIRNDEFYCAEFHTARPCQNDGFFDRQFSYSRLFRKIYRVHLRQHFYDFASYRRTISAL